MNTHAEIKLDQADFFEALIVAEGQNSAIQQGLEKCKTDPGFALSAHDFYWVCIFTRKCRTFRGKS